MLSIGVAGFQAGRPAIHPTRAVRAVRGESACMMAGKVVVTDGTSSFYESRGIFQSLHDHGDFSGIEAYSSGSGTTADAKKMLLSRNARYSGLLDLLTFSEGEPAEAFAGADTWLSINSDGATVSAQLAAAKAAGVKRVLLHYSANGPTDGTNADSLSGELSGLTYTVLRTGTLTKESGGGGMKVGELADPTCGEATKDDVYRIITEALSLDSASGKMLSLCSTDDVVQLKAMRQAGCTRREEADALLGGKIKETEVVAEAEETAEQKAERTKTETQKSEERKASHPPTTPPSPPPPLPPPPSPLRAHPPPSPPTPTPTPLVTSPDPLAHAHLAPLTLGRRAMRMSSRSSSPRPGSAARRLRPSRPSSRRRRPPCAKSVTPTTRPFPTPWIPRTKTTRTMTTRMTTSRRRRPRAGTGPTRATAARARTRATGSRPRKRVRARAGKAGAGWMSGGGRVHRYFCG
jgi:hypothetical protein